MEGRGPVPVFSEWTNRSAFDELLLPASTERHMPPPIPLRSFSKQSLDGSFFQKLSGYSVAVTELLLVRGHLIS